MDGGSDISAIDPGVGRLPAPVVAWPISRDRFGSLQEHWRRLGVWLTLWNRDGEMIACDVDAGRFWDALRGAGTPFNSVMASAVGAVMERDCHRAERDEPDAVDLGPWRPDLGLAVTPIRARRRCIGAVAAAFLTTHEPGEAFSRLCDQCGLDRRALASFAGSTGGVLQCNATAVAGLLSLSVEQARDIEVGLEEVSVLADNLETTYEELHLIYEISTQMRIPHEPTEMLVSVGRELLGVTRAGGLAFVLAEQEDAGEPGSGHEARLEDRIAQAGDPAPELGAIQPSTDSLGEELGADGGHILLNNAAAQSSLAWAGDWLKHLVVLPLIADGHSLGAVYAINCKDAGDFTSVDVQLLRAVADRISAALQNQHLYDDLTDLLLGLMHALVSSVDAKDPYTFGHSERVAFLSRSLAKATAMPEVDCERVYLAGLLHDIGKIGIPDAILCKPGRLTREEFAALKKHPEIGERILSRVRQIRDLMPGVLSHHERMDGRGYPHRLVGREIPVLGRIICLADSFDAMTTNRTYRSALSVSAGIAEIRRCSGSQFDPALAEAFIGLDLQTMFDEAHACSRGDPGIGRVGALCSTIGGYRSRRKVMDDAVTV